MAEKHYVWNGPPTAIEVVSAATKEGAAPIIHFEGMAIPGQMIAGPLPENHDQVKAWLAFNLITEVTVDVPAQPEPAQKSRKEALNG
jgi:hypothetical protein